MLDENLGVSPGESEVLLRPRSVCGRLTLRNWGVPGRGPLERVNAGYVWHGLVVLVYILFVLAGQLAVLIHVGPCWTRGPPD